MNKPHLSKIVRIKKTYIKQIGTGIILACLLVLSFWMRIQEDDALPDGHFTDTDPYLFYRQAKIISEYGMLPDKDMHRWLPYGRDNGQLLTLYSYTIAYTYNCLSLIFPNLSHYQIQLYLPAICFTVGLGVLFLFFARCYGLLFASIACVLLATLQGSVERSAIGFGDRDAFCLLFGILAIVSYLWREQIPDGYRRTIATIFCGLTVLLGGLSWAGYGVFLLVIMVVELWKFCTTDTEERILEYLIWIGTFVPWLFLLSPIYRRGVGFTTHVAALMLFPPLVVLLIRSTRYALLKHVKVCQTHGRKIAWGLTLLAITMGGLYCYVQYGAFELTAFAFKESRFMKIMAELVDPDFSYWAIRYGAVFVLGSIGMILTSSHFKTPQSVFLGGCLFLFTGTTFFRRLVDVWVGTQVCNMLFLFSVGLFAFALAIVAMRKTETSDDNTRYHELNLIAMIVWFILWVSFARSGKRYDFFIGVPLVFGTASLLWISPAFFNQEGSQVEQSIKQKSITTGIAVTILLAILFLLPFGGQVTRLYRANFKLRAPIPSQNYITDAIAWIKKTLPSNTVIAANWDYGMPLNVLGGVKTITDSDTYLPHWIHLYYRHVFCGQSEQEALAFLKTHNATHLMLTEDNVTHHSHWHSDIGSDEKRDRYFGFYALEPIQMPIGSPYRMVSPHYPAPFLFIDFDKVASDKITVTLKLTDKTSKQIDIHDPIALKMVSLDEGGLVLYFDEQTRVVFAFYVPPLGWSSFAVKKFLRGEYSNTFVQVYPSGDTDTYAKVKIWEIHYPSDIKADKKYLLTKPKTLLK